MASFHKNRSWNILLLVLALAVVSSLAQAQTGTGVIVGTVRGPTGDALANASVTVTGTNLAGKTNQQGMYRVGPVPAGDWTVVVTFMGMGTGTATAKVTAGQTVTADVRLSYTEAIEVSGSSFLQGQAKALNTQETATNITNVVSSDQMSRFPDINAAESTQRLPAVSLLRDQGEGRYVLVRGTEPRLNSTTVNGERLTATEGGGRSVALDTVPADILESIAISKTLTPDMDGDSIGGTVDLVTKRAPLEASTQASIGGGWADISQDYIGLASFTLGRRFSEGRSGILFSLSGNKSNKASDDQEPEYDEQNLIDLQLRDYTLTRERYAANFSFDQQLAAGSELFLRALWDEYRDSEIRRAFDNDVENSRINRATRDRTQTSHIYSLTGGGSILTGESVLNFRLAWNHSEEATPDQVTATFRQKKVNFAPNVSPGHIDTDNIQANPQNEDYAKSILNKIETQDKSASDEDWVGSLDLTHGFYKDTGLSGLWKVGVKARLKHNDQNYEVYDWTSEEDLVLTDYLNDWKPATSFINGFTHYDIGRFQSPSAMRDLLASGMLEGEKNLEEDLADYTIDEDTYAGYGLVNLDLGSNVNLVAGVRAENTTDKYDAFELAYDEEGNISALTPVSGKKSYTEWLPQVVFRYRLAERSNLRAAVTRSFARPNFGDIAPYQLINRESFEMTRGNPDLVPTTSWNYDLLFEHYMASVGLISGGLFYKQLTNNIFLSTFEEELDGQTYDVTQPVNGESGSLYGAEVAYQNRWASGFGLYFNYTWADSKATYTSREDTDLQGQAGNVGNLALIFEKWGFSGRLSLNYNGKSLFEVGSDATRDLYVDDHMQLDFSAQMNLGKNVTLFLEAINLTNEPYRVYEGSKDWTRQSEWYSWWGTIGVKLNF
jgi:TonB-dependent receptor